jgi:hypothetical protein
MSKMPELRTELLFTATVAVDPLIDLGPSALGDRRLVPIVSGTFEGPRMKGEILSGGIDWQLLRADKVAQIEAHYVLKTDDDVLIRVINCGFRYGPPEVMQRLAAGDPVDPSEYYFRAAPTFDAPTGRYDFLNRALFVSTGERYPGRVVLHFFQIL